MNWYYIACVVGGEVAGYAWATFRTRRRDQRRTPYRWHCPHCTVYVAGSLPVQVAEFTEQHLRELHGRGSS